MNMNNFLLRLLLISGGVFCFMFSLAAYDFLFESGTGTITKKFQKENPSGKSKPNTFHVLAGSKGVRVPKAVWDSANIGDHFEKSRFSFVFRVNRISHNELHAVLTAALMAAFIVGPIITFLIFYNERR
ncbi:MAG: hypothetical protein EOM80_18980 [Erysipelotrichia bacterium]|nr:hypothetical protein [Erysipelotrichia bacterium]